MKILVISDIHKDVKKLKSILNENMDKVDLKIYLGDFQLPPKKQSEFSSYFDYCVQGNMDSPGISPIQKIVLIDGIKILLVHGHLFETPAFRVNFSAIYDIAKNENIKIIMHGHDHIAANEEKDGIFRLNPGSISLPAKGEPSYGILEIENGEIKSWNIINC